jgi:hypothetical protein
MKHFPFFRYSINYKVSIFLGVFFLFLIVFVGVITRYFNINNYYLYFIIGFFVLIFLLTLFLFVYYVSLPLEKISTQILALMTGKPYFKVPPQRNDELGVIAHFFNTVTDRITDLSEDITTGKRMASELELAAKIQGDVLPKSIPDNIIGLDIVAASKASSEVGGDSFDFIPYNNDNTLIYIGDVTGHGVPAGLIMMLVSTTVRVLAKENLPPKEIIAKTNAILREKISSNHFMSFVMLNWNNMKQKLSYIGAGHEYILHYSKKEQKVNRIKSGGIALKMIPDISKILQEKSIDFQEGDVILLYTDGITEAKNNENIMYEIENLEDSFLRSAHRSAKDIFEMVTKDFSNFLGYNHEQADDITLIVMKNIGQHQEKQKVDIKVNINEQGVIENSKKMWGWE